MYVYMYKDVIYYMYLYIVAPANLGFDPLHFGDKKVCVCVYMCMYIIYIH